MWLWIAVPFFANAVTTSGLAEWQVGVATAKITPDGPAWMAGYASRTKPSEGVAQDIFAKALSIRDAGGGRAVIVTADLIGIPLPLRQYVEHEGARRFGLRPAEILLNASHTHSGPEVRTERLASVYNFSRNATPDQANVVTRYASRLREVIVDLIGAALTDSRSARLEVTHARAGFAMNRRRPEKDGRFTNNPNPDGPVDHEVPVLKVTGADGKLRALMFGYACHNTTLGTYQISGDYAGWAQEFLARSYPGTTALFLMGCGGDQNPYPRRAMVPDQPVEELVKHHGRALANAVSTALQAVPRSVRGPLRGAYDQALLAYAPLPAAELRKYLTARQSEDVRERARTLLRVAGRAEALPPLPCPVQVLQFGRDLTLVAIGGEVVIDYALRIKAELRGHAYVWVAGYSNNLFGYLGSRRVIEEGGYEGGSANTRILVHPGRFTPAAEASVMAKVHELHGHTNR